MLVSGTSAAQGAQALEIVAGIVFALILIAAAVALFLAGMGVGTRLNMEHRLREMGLTGQSAVLYARAAQLINRLYRQDDLDGDLSPDHLCPETKAEISRWAVDYRINTAANPNTSGRSDSK